MLIVVGIVIGVAVGAAVLAPLDRRGLTDGADGVAVGAPDERGGLILSRHRGERSAASEQQSE